MIVTPSVVNFLRILVNVYVISTECMLSVNVKQILLGFDTNKNV